MLWTSPRVSRRIVARIAASAVFACIGLAAQQAQRPLFRGGVDYIVVDVVVTDESDRPVDGLSRDDFEIVEGGIRQTIADFRYVSIPAETRQLSADERMARPADVFSNAPLQPDSRLFAIVIDDQHLLTTEIPAIKQVIADVAGMLSSDDEVAVVFTGRSDIGVNFTTQRSLLIDVAGRLRNALGFGFDALNRSANTPVGIPLRARDARAADRSALWTLTNVARALAASGHARRAILYISAGIATDPHAELRSPEQEDASALQTDLTAAFEAARRSGVPIYTLDPRGQVLPPDAVYGGTMALNSPEKYREAARRVGIQLDHLRDVAVNTGGRAFVNQSDLTKAVREILTENGSFYVLAYFPESFARDGRFHDIAVHVRRPGLRVRARQGYLAPSAAPATLDQEQMLTAALGSSLNAGGLPLRLTVLPVAMSAKAVTAAVTIDLTYPVGARARAPIDDTLRVGLVAVDADGKVKASIGRTWTIKSEPPTDALRLLVNETLDLPNQSAALRVGIASASLSAVGTVQLTLDLPRSSEAKLQMAPPAVGFGSPRGVVLGANLITGLVPFQPTTDRTFRESDILRVLIPLFWRSRDEAEVTVAVRGTMPELMRSVRVPPAASGDRQRAAGDVTLPLSGLSPGEHILEIRARLPNGQSAVREIRFEIQ
jgi:VWFA-related protein